MHVGAFAVHPHRIRPCPARPQTWNRNPGSIDLASMAAWISACQSDRKPAALDKNW